MIDLSELKSNMKAIENLSVTTKNALVGDGANQDNQNQRRMHQICEKSSPQMWANHALHMRAILSRLITFCSPHQIFQQMHPQCKQLGRKSEQETSNQMMHIYTRQCSHGPEYIIKDILIVKGAGRQTIGVPLKSFGYNGSNSNGDFFNNSELGSPNYTVK